MTDPRALNPTVANMLADALAHHEANPDLESLVLADPIYHAIDGEPHLARAWLDFERAGRVAAEALIEVAAPAGWTGPTPLFALRNTTSRPPDVGSGAETDVDRHGSSTSVRGEPGPAATGSGSRNLIGRMLGLARQVMPVEPQRHRFLVNQMRTCGLDSPTLGSLHQLDEDQLQGIITKLEIYGEATHRLVAPEPAA